MEEETEQTAMKGTVKDTTSKNINSDLSIFMSNSIKCWNLYLVLYFLRLRVFENRYLGEYLGPRGMRMGSEKG